MYCVTQEKKKRGGVRKKASGNQTVSRRAKSKYPYLQPKNSLISRREETEDVASYAHLLNDEEKAWMNQFMKEYNNADIGSLEEPTGIFHISKEDRKACTDRNNARNRCWYTQQQAENKLNLVGTDAELERLIYTDGELDEEV